MLELTPKEIETAGFNRYLKDKRRMAWAIILMAVGLAIGLVLVAILPKVMNSYAKAGIEIIPMLAGFWVYWRIIFIDAPKAGKKFREEWDKERQS